MWDYIVDELPELVFRELPLDVERQGITGHSMGGHGALTIAMTRPETYRSLSAISPIANPTQVGLGPQAVHRLPRRRRERLGARTTPPC